MNNFYYDLITKTKLNFEKMSDTLFYTKNMILQVISYENKKFQLRDRKQGHLLEVYDLFFMMNKYNVIEETAYNKLMELIVEREHKVIDDNIKALQEQILNLKKEKKKLDETSHVKIIAHFMNFEMKHHKMTGLNFNTKETHVVFCDDSYNNDVMTLGEIANVRPDVKKFMIAEELKPETKFVFCDSETFISEYV